MSYQRVDFRNQAPPSIMEMIHQRRRWVSGSLMDLNLLPIQYRVLVFLRLFAWGILPLAPLLYLPVIFEFEVYYYNLYLIGIIIQTFFAFLWILIGIRHCNESTFKFLILLLTIPFVSILNSLGASWALVKRSEEFRPTKKIPPKEAEEDYSQFE